MSTQAIDIELQRGKTAIGEKKMKVAKRVRFAINMVLRLMRTLQQLVVFYKMVTLVACQDL